MFDKVKQFVAWWKEADRAMTDTRKANREREAGDRAREEGK